MSDLLPVLLAIAATLGSWLWGVAATWTRRWWHHTGTLTLALLAGTYWAEVGGLDHRLSVLMVRTIGVVWITFAGVAVPAWIVKVTRRHRQMVAELEEVARMGPET